MKLHALALALGFVGASVAAQAQTAAPAPPDPLADLQGVFGKVVGDAFHRPDPIIASVSTPGSPAVAIGGVLRDSMVVPGAVFAGVLQPFAAIDKAETAAAAPPPAPAPLPRRHARLHHHHATQQG